MRVTVDGVRWGRGRGGERLDEKERRGACSGEVGWEGKGHRTWGVAFFLLQRRQQWRGFVVFFFLSSFFCVGSFFFKSLFEYSFVVPPFTCMQQSLLFVSASPLCPEGIHGLVGATRRADASPHLATAAGCRRRGGGPGGRHRRRAGRALHSGALRSRRCPVLSSLARRRGRLLLVLPVRLHEVAACARGCDGHLLCADLADAVDDGRHDLRDLRVRDERRVHEQAACVVALQLVDQQDRLALLRHVAVPLVALSALHEDGAVGTQPAHQARELLEAFLGDLAAVELDGHFEDPRDDRLRDAERLQVAPAVAVVPDAGGRRLAALVVLRRDEGVECECVDGDEGDDVRARGEHQGQVAVWAVPPQIDEGCRVVRCLVLKGRFVDADARKNALLLSQRGNLLAVEGKECLPCLKPLQDLRCVLDRLHLLGVVRVRLVVRLVGELGRELHTQAVHCSLALRRQRLRRREVQVRGVLRAAVVARRNRGVGRRLLRSVCRCAGRLRAVCGVAFVGGFVAEVFVAVRVEKLTAQVRPSVNPFLDAVKAVGTIGIRHCSTSPRPHNRTEGKKAKNERRRAVGRRFARRVASKVCGRVSCVLAQRHEYVCCARCQ
eukprot:Rhum_TRINITY_DN14744_c22_g1::Rhum_TRINITY_DN14744_c22_g1_i1::g.114315::m.114315